MRVQSLLVAAVLAFCLSANADTFPIVDVRNGYLIGAIRSGEWIDPTEGELVHCCGFPTDHNVTADRKMICKKEEIGIAVYPTIFNGKVLPQPSERDLKFYITDFDPNRHYLIPYVCSGSKHPRGVSGAAIWWGRPARDIESTAITKENAQWDVSVDSTRRCSITRSF